LVSRSAPRFIDRLTPLLRPALWIGLFVAALAVGFGAPVIWKLDREVRAEFEALQWQIPTRVFARPLALVAGEPMSVAALEQELEAAAFAPGDGRTPGTFVRDGATFRIATRGFRDVDGAVDPARGEVRIANGRIAQVRRTDGGGPGFLLDPARIATLYGAAQEERELIRVEDAPPLLVAGLQAVEDRNFRDHIGVDPWGVLRAMFVNVREGELVQGGSTITQQLVRSLFLSNARTASRKAREAAYALIIEARFDKRRILETYLNEVYLGQQGAQAVHGVGAASRFWFGRDVEDLRAHEIALLIAMIQGPSHHDPRRFPERAKARRDLVLGVFHDTGLLTEAERDAARRQPLGVLPRPGLARNRFPAFLDAVRRQLARDYDADDLTGAGLTVHTTLAPSAQREAEASVRRTLEALDRPGRPPLQAALVLTDARSGDVRAVVGDRHPAQPGFNRALDARRPVGSLLKPMVYLLALAQPGRWSLASPIDDGPVSMRLPNGQEWAPKNANGRSHGVLPLEDALVHSYNQATVRLGMDVGPERLAALLEALAEIEAEPNPALILGSVDLSPFAMAQSYQFLASGGRIQPLRAVRGVLSPEGEPVTRYDGHKDEAQEGDAIAARLVTLALQEAARRGTARALAAGATARLAAAGKTGTSNDGRDSWFAGYTGSHLAVAWVGNDRNEATGLYGATGAMRIWQGLFATLPSAPLQAGEQGIEWAYVAQGQFATTESECTGARRYPFVAGFLPAEHLSCVERGLLDFFGFGADRP
jgi:penicillin-binding protein 1B